MLGLRVVVATGAEWAIVHGHKRARGRAHVRAERAICDFVRQKLRRYLRRNATLKATHEKRLSVRAHTYTTIRTATKPTCVKVLWACMSGFGGRPRGCTPHVSPHMKRVKMLIYMGSARLI